MERHQLSLFTAGGLYMNGIEGGVELVQMRHLTHFPTPPISIYILNPYKFIGADEMIQCACGCGTWIEDKDNRGRNRRFALGHQRTNEFLHDYEWMYQKYSADKLSSYTIGKILNCSFSTVLKHLKQLGIHIRSNNETKEGVAFTEEHKTRIGDANRGQIHTIETRDNMSAAHIGQIQSFETRKRRSITLRGITEEDWDGFVCYMPYCEKFNEKFKEKIREFFGRKCFICGRKEEDNAWGRYHYKLSVHHVNYDKDCLCDGQDCFFVPLCLRCHARTNGNRVFWQNIITEKMQKEGYLN
jgi:hypothetical protein